MVTGEPTRDDGDRAREALDRINAALRGLRYGTVTAVVQDGVVVQVERTEKFRLAGRGVAGAGSGPPDKSDGTSTVWRRR